MLMQTDQFSLVSVSLWGISCGVKAYPEGFGRVSEARDFIDEYVTGHEWKNLPPSPPAMVLPSLPPVPFDLQTYYYRLDKYIQRSIQH